MNESVWSFFSVQVTLRPIQNTTGSRSRPVRLYGLRTVIAVALPSTLAIATDPNPTAGECSSGSVGERLAGAEQPAHDRPGGDAQSLGRLLVGQAEQVDGHERVALVVGQRRDA